MPRPASTESQASQPDPVQRRKYLAGPGALLGGPANVVMQLSLAPVGRGVVESTVDSGRFDLHPRKRGRTTLTYLAVAMLGTDEERAAYRAATDTSHRQVRSRPGSPVKYNAFDPELQLWVAACIYRGVVDSLTYLYGPLDTEEADELYRESARFGTTLQMRPEMWPADRAAFARYWETKSAEISLDAEVKAYLLEQVVDLVPTADSNSWRSVASTGSSPPASCPNASARNWDSTGDPAGSAPSGWSCAPSEPSQRPVPNDGGCIP